MIPFPFSPIHGDQQQQQQQQHQQLPPQQQISTHAIQMNQIHTPIQQIDIKTEHQTLQKQTIQVVQRPQMPLPSQNANQQFIAQSLPPNNNTNVNISISNVNLNIDQMASGGGGANTGVTIDDNLSNTGSNTQSTSYNQKTYERMRKDEGKFAQFFFLLGEISS